MRRASNKIRKDLAQSHGDDLSAEFFTEEGGQFRTKRTINEFDYLSKLCEHGVLTRAQERSYLERYHDPKGSQASRDEAFEVLVSSNIKLIMRVAKFYAATWRVPIDDLVQEGTIGLIRAIQGFDLRKNVKLSTYATNWIRQSISRQSPALARNIRLPSHAITALHKISRAREKLEEQNGRLPSDQELADAVKISLPKLQLYLAVESDTGSLNEKVGLNANSELVDLIPNKLDPSDSDRAKIISDALDKLSLDHRTVLLQRYGEKLSVPLIADERGVTVGVVRRLLQDAELRLKRLLEPHVNELI